MKQMAECDRCGEYGECEEVDGITTIENGVRRLFLACCHPRGSNWFKRSPRFMDSKTQENEEDMIAMLEM